MKRTCWLLHGIMATFLVVLLIPMTADAGDVPRPHPAKAFKGEQCVEPAPIMRREHMSFLKHQRDETMRDGIRGNKYSLTQCVECHAVPEQGKTERSLEPFCASCHQYAAVKIDCFECHTNKPAKPITKSNLRPNDGKATDLALLLNTAFGRESHAVPYSVGEPRR